MNVPTEHWIILGILFGILTVFGLYILYALIGFVAGLNGNDIWNIEHRERRRKERLKRKGIVFCEDVGHDYVYKFHPTEPTNICRRCGKS